MDEPERPDPGPTTATVAVGGGTRRLYGIIGVLLVVIVVLLVRPWGDGDAAPASASDSPRAVVPPGAGSAAPTGSPGEEATGSLPAVDSYRALEVTCGSPSGWRAATLQDWPGRATPIRSWIAIRPVPASGPLDPAIEFAPVSTGVVTAIGYCAPLDDANRPPVTARASLWAIGDGGAVPLSSLPLEPASPDALGGLWRPPPEVRESPPASGSPASGSTAGPVLWPPGSYVIEVASPGGAYGRWLGIEIADLSLRKGPPPGAPGSPAAGGSPAVSPTP